jgi:hypothetical protein
MKRTLLLVMSVAVIAGACTEHLTTPGSCPTFCPGGQSVFRDTTLTPVLNGDTSFTGFLEATSLVSVLTSSGGNYGQNRAVIRFLARTDSVLVLDTNRVFTLDSIALEVGLQAIDTTVAGFVLEIYRLPRTTDSTATFATIDALMTPANKITEVPEPASFRSGLITLVFGGDTLSRFAFTPGDSTVLELGFRVRASGPTAARIGTPASGTFAPLFTSYVHALGVADTLAPQTKAVISDLYFTATPPPATPPSGTLLAVGGIPVARSFLRFALPPYLHDSATIIRATLHLQADVPVFGIPADTAQLVATDLIADFGAKSPPFPGYSASTPLLPGASTADLEIATLVQLWQGVNGVPPIVRLTLGQEGGTFVFPQFRSTRSVSGTPTLRITYRPPFAFQGY